MAFVFRGEGVTALILGGLAIEQEAEVDEVLACDK